MAEIEQVPTIGISISRELPGKQNLVLQTLIERDCEQKALDGTLDKLRIASERQFAFGMVEILKMQLEQEEKLAADHMARVAQVDENLKAEWSRSNKRGDPQLSPKQRQDQLQAHTHTEECKKRIAKVKRDIAEYEAKIGA